jgi:hypothetical protein
LRYGVDQSLQFDCSRPTDAPRRWQALDERSASGAASAIVDGEQFVVN